MQMVLGEQRDSLRETRREVAKKMLVAREAEAEDQCDAAKTFVLARIATDQETARLEAFAKSLE